MKAASFLATALLTTPAYAGPLLWKNIEAGMTVEQVRALYPEQPKRVAYKEDRVELKGVVQLPECGTADVRIQFGAGVVSKVVARKEDLGVFKFACSPKAYQLMVQQYGPPTTETKKDGEALTYEYQEYTTTWLRDDVAITMERKEGVDEWWQVTYAPKSVGSGL